MTYVGSFGASFHDLVHANASSGGSWFGSSSTPPSIERPHRFSSTENGFFVDGRLTKLGAELRWDYSWDEPMLPWHVRDPGGQLDLVLTPVYDKHTEVDAGELGSETHQVFGTWSGHLVTDDGHVLLVEGVQGFAEEARQRW